MQFRKMARDTAQHAGLIRAARAASTEDERQSVRLSGWPWRREHRARDLVCRIGFGHGAVRADALQSNGPPHCGASPR
jgi:hypothetical protein